MIYTNETGIPLSVAVFLASDYYDYNPKAISATTLLKPIRQVVLSKRVKPGANIPDISEMIASRMGSAIHDGVERAWTTNYQVAMKALGYPQDIIDRIRVNPDPATVKPEDIPVYMEIRSSREVNGVTVSGKFDFIGNGKLEDFKSTSVYTWIHDRKDDDYILQGSIYRWLNPELVTDDTMNIQFFFTDWQKHMARVQADYPQARTMKRSFALLPLDKTELYVRNRIDAINLYMDKPDEEIPLCTDKELWRKEDAWKYYKNPMNKTRATKNFDNELEALARWQDDGCVGEVVKIPGQVTACKYCPAYTVCQQARALEDNGELVFE